MRFNLLYNIITNPVSSVDWSITMRATPYTSECCVKLKKNWHFALTPLPQHATDCIISHTTIALFSVVVNQNPVLNFP